MSLDWLSIHGLRNLDPLELTPGPGVNWFHGPNGAGKTSILEAIYLLARGRSFRAANISGVIQHGADSLSVVARRAGAGDTLGVERRARDWRGRIASQDCRRISEFAIRLPLVLIEPDSHRLVDGGPDRRRQFLDWLLFHVEHSYLKRWQRYARLLRQRNAALKQGASTAVLDAIDGPFLAAAEHIDKRRRAQVEQLAERLEPLTEKLAFALPRPVSLRYRPGHAADSNLSAALAAGRDRDRDQGFTRTGPHRAELVLSVNGHPAAAELSRGQQKLLAILLQAAHLELVLGWADHSPMLLLDDPVSELDEGHLDRLLGWLRGLQLQSWVTATRPGPDWATMFHVEQGRVRPVV